MFMQSDLNMFIFLVQLLIWSDWDSLLKAMAQMPLLWLFLLLKTRMQFTSSSCFMSCSSFKVTENMMSAKLSVWKMLSVELFRMTLTGVLGGFLKPGRSSLMSSRSPSLITQGSSRWGLCETRMVLTNMGRI